MTEWEAVGLGRTPYGERVGRISCTKAGGIIAWIMRRDDEIAISKPPYMQDVRVRSSLRVRFTPLEAREGYVAVECPTCGVMEVEEERLLAAVANGQRNAVVKI